MSFCSQYFKMYQLNVCVQMSEIVGGPQGNITAQGKLLMQEPLVVSEVSGNDKTKELHVFLFEQCVIFSEAVGKKNQFTSPTFNYKGHLLVK